MSRPRPTTREDWNHRRDRVVLAGALVLLIALSLPPALAAESGERAGGWRGKPGMYAVMTTSEGSMVFELYPKEAPKTVENFVGLAEGTKEFTDPTSKQKTKRRFYDGTLFHRVIPGLLIQGGDALGNGHGGVGYVFEDEFSPNLGFEAPGRLAMAHAKGRKDMNGSQFFITASAARWLNYGYTIFGQLVEGGDTVTRLTSIPVKGDTSPDKETPVKPPVLKKVEIVRVGSEVAAKP